MINLMKADLYRLTKSKGMIFFLLSIAATYLITLVMKQEGGIVLSLTANAPDGMKMDIRMVGQNFTYYFLLIIPVFSIVTADFSEHTYKNTITSAISRGQYFIHKFLFSELLCTALFLCPNILFYAVNRAFNGEKYASAFGDYMKAVMTQLPVIIAVIAVFVLLAFLFRKAALFNSVTIIAPILYTTIAMVLWNIDSSKDFTEKYLLKYELNGMLSTLAVNCTDSYRNTSIVISLCAVIISFVLGYLTFTKRELD